MKVVLYDASDNFYSFGRGSEQRNISVKLFQISDTGLRDVIQRFSIFSSGGHVFRRIRNVLAPLAEGQT